MIDKFKNTIPLSDTNNCFHESKRKKLKIYDDEKKWCVVVKKAPFHFLIKNPSSILFYFFAIDKCCLNNKFKGRRCDFGILIENQSIYLIEIKDTIEDERKKSNPIQQLESTIKFFEEKNLLDEYKTRFAVLCWKMTPPIPLTDSSYNTAKFRFAKQYKFRLQEGNSVKIS